MSRVIDGPPQGDFGEGSLLGGQGTCLKEQISLCLLPLPVTGFTKLSKSCDGSESQFPYL